jgi:hypothetical protein
MKNDIDDYIMLPASEPFALPLDIYNFGTDAIEGKLTIHYPEEASMSPLQLPVRLGAGEKSGISPDIVFPRLHSEDGTPFLFTITGEFPGIPRSILSLNVKPVITSISRNDILTDIVDARKPGKWSSVLIKTSRMNIRTRDEWLFFDCDFGPAENVVINHVWAAPQLSVLPENIPQSSGRLPDALVLDIRQLEGSDLRIAVNVVEKNGAAYIGFPKIDPAALHSGSGTTIVVPFDIMSNPTYRPKDDNRKLDIEDIRSIEIAMWTKPHSKVLLGIKNLRWVTFSKTP